MAEYRITFARSARHELEVLDPSVIRRIPDQVEITTTGDWKYSRAFEAPPGSIKVVEREASGDLVFSS